MKVLNRLACITCVSATVSAFPTNAAAVVAPNAYANTAGYEYQLSVFGNGSAVSGSFQEGFAASELASVPVGARITGIGYRLASNLPTVDDDVSYLDFTVRIGSSTVPISSLSLSATANQGVDTVAARTGAFTLAGGSLVNTRGLNPFYAIAFATPYRYQGGDLLVTTSYSIAGAVPFIGVDSVDPFGVVNTLGGNDPAFLRTHLFNAPIVEFTTASGAVPEPTSWLMLIIGFGAIGLVLRARGVGAAAA